MNNLTINELYTVKDILEIVRGVNTLMSPTNRKSYLLRPKEAQNLLEKVNQLISERREKPKVIISVANGFINSIMHNMSGLEASVIDYDIESTDSERLSLIKLPNQKLKAAVVHEDLELLQIKDDFDFVWKQCCNDKKLEPVCAVLTDDNKGFYSLYAGSGQIVQRDFVSENEAETWAINNDYRIVKTFN